MENRFGLLSNLPPVIKNLLILNFIGFVGTMIFPLATRMFGVFYPDSPFFFSWQIITYMFMHGGIAHLFFNMFALFMFGPVIEKIMGSKRFVYFYLITGLGALALQFLVQGFEVYNLVGTPFATDFLRFDLSSGMVYSDHPSLSQEGLRSLAGIYNTPMVGASGAIFGILVAFGVLFPETSLYLMFIPVPVKAKYFIPFYILVELFLGVSQIAGDSVAHFAHIGGALFGFLLIKFWKIRRPMHW